MSYFRICPDDGVISLMVDGIVPRGAVDRDRPGLLCLILALPHRLALCERPEILCNDPDLAAGFGFR